VGKSPHPDGVAGLGHGLGELDQSSAPEGYAPLS